MPFESYLFRTFLEPFKRNKCLRFDSQLKKLNCSVFPSLTSQNTFKILHFGFNFVSDMAQVEKASSFFIARFSVRVVEAAARN